MGKARQTKLRRLFDRYLTNKGFFGNREFRYLGSEFYISGENQLSNFANLLYQIMVAIFANLKKQRNNKNEKYKTQKIFFSISNDFFENVFSRN